MKTGSGIDWFDLQVKISFGDQEVSLKEVRKAVLSKQNIVVLGDGTFGVLPEEWLEQYGMLLKMGDDQKDGSLRLSKLHFTIIDDLHNEIDDETVLQEIEIKKQKLRDIEAIRTTAISRSIKAKLRPYQVCGFQWLQTLDELGWGGCLADDMGLGKTLQTITFLQCMKEKYKGSTHLVVCPTSLIYNWEAELKKFAPKLKYHIYYGAGREFTDEHFENYDIIITSYGLVRNDMEQLLRFQWHYVILDESQAIKNPDAQTTKAVQLLKSKNRLILSGTPVQNNTFDLFAQFNFLNAGLLGNKEFYKTEFANPIDKYNDADKSKQLRKLVYPFLLRRTKEEVAKDLPAKTETILWCQLPKDQRSVYEDYKNYYRSMLMKKIEEEGMSKAGIYVLEGLLRLRQICDSPQLVKDEEVTTKESIKITELLREIEENTGSHKLLVFSQFTEMLHLIEMALKQKNISFCYLDGSTPAVKRKEQVEKFQSDESVKIFLISLKAGGLGLNLTAADYVYIVDPWWNPAVEQQAIDRTHRIGQTQKIFAYKMICKDTVEEKIIQLQQRKKQLANELVTEDAGFIKKLKKEDVEFLFS
jgi:non-specific serine/threonine protein kinase